MAVITKEGPNSAKEYNNVVFDGNMFNSSGTGNANNVNVNFTIPLDNEAQDCDDTFVSGPCTMEFGTDARLPSGSVLGYPRGMVGSMGGRFCTTGFHCGKLTELPGGRREGDSPIFDLNTPNAIVGLPSRLDDLTSLNLIAGGFHCEGVEPIVNYFIDAYLYDTNQNPPAAQYAGTINGINARNNRMWNPNVWFGHPNSDAMWQARQANNAALENTLITTFTGGVVVDEVTIDGHQYKIVFKHEQFGGNNFFYVGFVWVEQANGSAPNANDWNIDYLNGPLAYLQTAAFWQLVQTSGQAIANAMAQGNNGQNALTLVRPNGQMFIDGVAIGNEYWGMPTNGTRGTICWNNMQWEVNGPTFGKALTNVRGCEFPVNVNVNNINPNPTGCNFVVDVSSDFSCLFPMLVVSDFFGAVADCATCPQLEVIPKISVPFDAAERSILPSNFIDFPDGTQITINSAVLSGNLTGSIGFDSNDVVYSPDRRIHCDIECGRLTIGYDYQCPDSELVRSCTITVEICSFPAANVNAFVDQTIIVTPGTFPVIPATPPILDGNEACEAIKGPPFGSLNWIGNGWELRYPSGAFGTFDVIVPGYANGDKAHETMRCITICIPGTPLNLDMPAGCLGGLLIKDKLGEYKPVARVTSFEVSVDSVSSGDFVDFEGCEYEILAEERKQWTGSIGLTLLCGDRGLLMSGRDIELMFVKDLRDFSAGRFVGKARVTGGGTSFQASRQSDDAQALNLTLEGHGQFWSQGFVL